MEDVPEGQNVNVWNGTACPGDNSTFLCIFSTIKNPENWSKMINYDHLQHLVVRLDRFLSKSVIVKV